MRETPVFKVDDVTAQGAPGLLAVVAARNPARPLIAAGGDMTLSIGARGTLVLDGLVFSGGALTLAAAADDEPRELVLRDCTLVPGLRLNPDGSAVSPGAPSLVVEHPFAKVTLERCITGPIMIDSHAELTMVDCIVDAGDPQAVAYAADAAGGPGAQLTARECTIVGKVHTRLIELASNSIFFARLGAAPGETWSAPVIAERRQEGCMRFCFVPSGSITPRRFRCVPDGDHPDAAPAFHLAALRRSGLRPAASRDRPCDPRPAPTTAARWACCTRSSSRSARPTCACASTSICASACTPASSTRAD